MIDPFYKDSTFYSGVMATGLAIMSGANPLQAFQAGQGQMQQADVKQQLQGNRDYLLQNYTGDSVANAIAKGDPSLLKQKQMSEEDRMAAENQVWSQRNQAANQEWDRRQAIESQAQAQQQAASDQRYNQRMDENEARQKRMVDYRLNQAAAAKQQQAAANANNYNFDYRELNAEGRAGGYDTNKQWTDKAASFEVGMNDLQQARDAKKAGDAQAARAGYMQTMLNMIRGEVVTNKSLQPEDVRHFGGDPSMWVKQGNDIVMKSNAAPTDDAMDYLQKSLHIGLTSANHSMEQFKKKRIDSLIKSKWDPRRATALVNQRAGGAFYDPFNAFGSELTPQEREGALSGADTSWMQTQ